MPPSLTVSLAQQGAAFLQLRRCVKEITDYGPAFRRLSVVKSRWLTLKSFAPQASVAKLLGSVVYAVHMAGYWIMWRWLETIADQQLWAAVGLVDASLAIHTDTDTADDVQAWAKSLSREILRCYTRRTNSHAKGRSRSIPIAIGDILSSDEPCSVNITIKDYSVLGLDLVKAVVFHGKLVLAQWLGLFDASQPEHVNSTWFVRGLFLQEVLRWAKAPGVLLLDEVQHGFRQPSPYVFQSIAEPDISSLRNALEKAFQPNSSLSRTLPLLTKVVIHFRDELCHLPIPEARPEEEIEEEEQDELDEEWGGLSDIGDEPGISIDNQDTYNGEEVEVEEEEDELEDEDELNLGAAEQLAHVDPASIQPAMRHLKTMWDALLSYPDMPAPQNPIFSWAIKDKSKFADQRIPFREIAPSRRAVLAEPSPFGPSSILTRAGMFSALVFRGITFGTEALLVHGLRYFESLEDWHRKTGKLAQRAVCIPSAYGVYAMDRSADNAPSYWEKAGLLVEWLKALGDKRMRGFVETSNKLKSELTGFGDLTATLMTIDLVYAKAVVPPTDEAFASHIFKTNKGAVSGLRHLGVIPWEGSAHTPDNVDRFVKLYRACKANFHGQTFDIFVFEHMLCKYTRCSQDRATGLFRIPRPQNTTKQRNRKSKNKVSIAM